MRALFLISVVLAACSNQPNAATSPTPSPTPVITTAAPSPTSTASSSPSPSPTPTASNSPLPSPITLPSTARLSAPSATVVWVLVAGQRLFRSSDRGDTWEERPLPTSLLNASLGFASDRDGFILNAGPPGTQCTFQSTDIWRTSDAAVTWTELAASGIAEPQCKANLSAATATRAFFVAFDPNHPPVIYRTADGGRTWIASKPLPDPPGFTTGDAGVVLYPGPVRAFGSTILVTADGQSNGQVARYVFRSTDGGATFTYASTVPTFDGTVAFVTPTRWLQVAPPNSSKETTDGGATWHAYTTDYSQAAPIAPEVVFGDASVGYATVRGAIQRTTDGGARWTTIKAPGTE